MRLGQQIHYCSVVAGAPVSAEAGSSGCGITFMCRHSRTNSFVSKPLSPPTVIRPSPGTCSSISSAVSRSAVPVASQARAFTINQLAYGETNANGIQIPTNSAKHAKKATMPYFITCFLKE